MNKLCNQCKYREVFDFLGTNFVSCVCDMCIHFVNGDCPFISCDFMPRIDNILDLPGVLCLK